MKKVLIVGGGGAIGSATARLLLDDGCSVVITGRSAARLESMRLDLGGHDRVACVVFDAANRTAAVEGVNAAAHLLNGLDAVVNCAAIFRDPVPVDQLSSEELALTMNANFNSAANVIVAASPHLKDAGGSIVNVAAIDAFEAHAGYAAEASSKAALVAFSKHAAVDLAPYRIRVNVVAPGWVKTPMTASLLEKLGLMGTSLSVPLVGRIGEATEVAEVIRFLVLDRSSYVNGSTIVVDGGHFGLLTDARS